MRAAVISFVTLLCALVAVPSLSRAQDAPLLTADEVVAIAATRTLPTTLTTEQQTILTGVIGALKQDDTVGAARQWATFCSGFFTSTDKAAHESAIVRYVLRRAYLEPNRELNEAAQRVAFYRAQANAARDQLNSLRARQTESLRRTSSRTTVPVLNLTPAFALDAAAILSMGTELMTAAEIDVAVRDWEARMADLAGQAAATLIQAQEQIEALQQLCQLMSNAAKACHEISGESIRNIRA